MGARRREGGGARPPDGWGWCVEASEGPERSARGARVREAGSGEGRPRASAARDWRQDEYAQRRDPALSWEQ